MSILLRGKCSWFGGPKDTGVKSNEGLALVSKTDLDKFDGYFLAKQPSGTTGLARRLDPDSYYIACRWNYKQTSREYLQGITVSVCNPNKPGILEARPVDWGPNAKTGRVADLSPGLMKALGLDTNGIVEVDIPLPSDAIKESAFPPQIFVDTSKASPSGLPVLTKQIWPLQRDAPKFYPDPAHNLVAVETPWEMHYGGKPVNHIMVHRKCADSLKRVLAYIWASCDKDQEKIAALHYDRYSGSYNPRPIRGGSYPSMHSFGAAIDFDDEENQQHSQHHLFTDDSLIVKAFKAESWVWGGDWGGNSIDSMHFQSARVHGG